MTKRKPGPPTISKSTKPSLFDGDTLTSLDVWVIVLAICYVAFRVGYIVGTP